MSRNDVTASDWAARIAGGVLLVGLGALFALRLYWVVGHVADLRPVAGGDVASALSFA